MLFHSKYATVDVEPQKEEIDNDVVAIRIRELGLTGYGNTIGEAMGDCRNLFERFASAYHEKGKLAEVLNSSGVRWQHANTGV